MKSRDLLQLILLGMLWGASFLFMRVSAPEFGAVPLIEVRVLLAALILVPVLAVRGQLAEARANWRPILFIGVLHYAMPFTLFAYSMLTLSGGYSAIVNASSPLFATLAAWLWLGEYPGAARLAGLLTGVAGVAILVSETLYVGDGEVGLAIAASMLASACYGLAAVYARKRLAHVKPITVAGGSMVAAGLVLFPASLWFWPASVPSVSAWSMAAALGVLCTALAFVMYFRLIANIGPARAITVTFLIPVFAVVFGAAFAGESISLSMLAGGAVVLIGTAMSVGLIDISEAVRRHLSAMMRAGRLMLLARHD